MRALLAILVAILVLSAGPIRARAQTQFTVINSGLNAYNIDGVDNPSLSLVRGQTYVFNVTAIGHPFYLKTARITGTGSQFTSGVTGQGVTQGSCTFVVPMAAPSTLFYQCSVHSSMGGTLNITDPVGVPPDIAPETAWLGPAVPNPSSHGATFQFSIPRDARIEFNVLDLSGRSVRELSNGVLPAGSHTLRWDGRDRAGHVVPSGLYIYLLKYGDRARSGRLLVMR